MKSSVVARDDECLEKLYVVVGPNCSVSRMLGCRVGSAITPKVALGFLPVFSKIVKRSHKKRFLMESDGQSESSCQLCDIRQVNMQRLIWSGEVVHLGIDGNSAKAAANRFGSVTDLSDREASREFATREFVRLKHPAHPSRVPITHPVAIRRHLPTVDSRKSHPFRIIGSQRRA